MGDFDGISEDSSELENKTDKPSNKTDDAESKFKKESVQQVVQSGEKNVLNGYRSVTYNFTLAALKKSALKDPTEYRNSALQLVILKSGGKGASNMQASANMDTSGQAQQARTDYAAKDPRRTDLTPEEKSGPLRNYGNELMSSFNEKSPGRFDMFIENIEIESVMAFNEQSGTSQPTQIKFDVIEPYSVNGFIEALHVSALSAGYPSYASASFVLKMEFWGYPDSDTTEFKDPINIPLSTRYYPIGLTGMEVDITEKGTRYKCSAVPYNERAFGQPSVIKKAIKMSGSNVGEILNDFIKAINTQIANSDKEGKEGSQGNNHDIYSIKFPSWSDTQGWVDSPANEISKSELNAIFKDSALYKMVDPSTMEKSNAYKANGSKQPSPDKQAKEPESIKYTPGKTVIQFAEEMNINEAIAAVIRDSQYVRNILKNVKANMDAFGMVEYFLIKIEVNNLDVIDENSKKPFQEYCYVITPYKIHYTKIPNYGSDLIKEEDLKKSSKREYNYIYTGQNVDIVNFKLNFNTLFFEAIPAAMGNKDVVGAKNAAAPNNEPAVKTSGTSKETQEKNQVPLNPVKTTVTPTQYASGNAGQPLTDPYSVLAKNMHEAMINSKASMITGEIEILGDPFYLVTGGIGNYNPKPTSRGVSEQGEAAHNFGSLLITINFRNPVDISKFEDGGMMYFDPIRVPFSGVYMVTKVGSSFKDGQFKQRVEVIRMPGQILDQNLKASDPADRMASTISPANQVVPDVTRGTSPSQRLDASTAMEQLSRGLPSPGLPGMLSNFTAATGGLGGSTAALLNQTPGLSALSKLPTVSSVIGQAIPANLSSNIRLNSAGLGSLNQSGLSSAALVAIATNVVTGNLPTQRAVGAIAGGLIGSALASALRKPTIGSGIGDGATISVSPSSTTLAPSLAQINGANTSPTSLASDALSNISGSVKQLGTDAVNAVTSIGRGVGNLVGGIGDKLNSLTATSSDPSGTAAKLGLDPSKLSGLPAPFQSKALAQMETLSKNTPENVNLTQAASAGLVLDYIPASKIANIPATPPYATAPVAEADAAYTKQVVAKGGMTALENLYGVTSANKLSSNLVPSDLISAAMLQVSNARLNPFSNIAGIPNLVDINVSKDKLSSARSQLSGLTGSVPIPDKFASGSVSSVFGGVPSQSPLDKLVNKLNDPNAPPYTGDDPIVRARLGMPPLNT